MTERPTRILVTGASGFVGRPLVAALLDAGHRVRAATRTVDRVPKHADARLVPSFEHDIDWMPFVEGVDAVIHLAALVHADESSFSARTYDRVNCQQTEQLALASQRAGVARFVYLSSVRAQIGPSAPKPISEADAPCPTDHYGRSKLAAERAIRSAGVPFTILRPSVVYGPNSKGNIKTILRCAALPLPVAPPSFKSRRSLLGIDNLISAIMFVLNSKAAAGGTYLVADSEPLTIDQLFTILRTAQGRRPGFIDLPPVFFRLALWLTKGRPHWQRLSEDLVVDTRKMRALGWRPPVDTYAGLLAMIRGIAAVPAARCAWDADSQGWPLARQQATLHGAKRDEILDASSA